MSIEAILTIASIAVSVLLAVVGTLLGAFSWVAVQYYRAVERNAKLVRHLENRVLVLEIKAGIQQDQRNILQMREGDTA